MQLSIMACHLGIAALGQHPSLGSRDEAVPCTRDTHFLAGIRKVFSTLPGISAHFPDAPGKAVRTVDSREFVSCFNTTWKC